MSHRTSLVIADDHPLVLHGLTGLIHLEPDFDILAICTDGSDAIERIREHCPDIALIDLNMPGSTGLEILRQVKTDAMMTRIVLLTADISDSEIVSAVSSGIDGLLLKNAASDSLVSCLREVAAGRKWLPAAIVGVAVDREIDRGKRADKLLSSLTHRETQIVRLACLATPNKIIATDLMIAEGTVKIHLNNAYSKLGVASRSELQAKLGSILDVSHDK